MAAAVSEVWVANMPCPKSLALATILTHVVAQATNLPLICAAMRKVWSAKPYLSTTASLDLHGKLGARGRFFIRGHFLRGAGSVYFAGAALRLAAGAHFSTYQVAILFRA